MNRWMDKKMQCVWCVCVCVCVYTHIHIAVVVPSLSHVWLYDPMNCSTPGFSVYHWLPEFTQTHVHWVDVAIQPSHPLSPPSPPAFNLSQHQGLFQWVSSSHQVPKVLELWLQLSLLPMNIQGWFLLGLTGWISLLSKGLSRVFSSTTVWKHQFFGTQPSLWSSSHIHTWLLEKNHSFDYRDLHQQSDDMLFRFVIAFLPRSKHLLISWLQSLSAVILVPKKITLTSNFPPSICHLVMGLDAIILLSFY